MSPRRTTAAAVVVAVVLDAAFREPPPAAHPVRWTGRYLAWSGKRVPSSPPGRAIAAGGLAWALGAVTAYGAGRLVWRSAARLPGPVRPLVVGVALWPLFAHRMLLDEVAAVERALEAGGVEAGRAAVGRIVSRDVSGLTADEVRQAAVESLGENLSDSVVAPLFWYAVGGLPAAALYRFANTADAVWGYRTPRWEHAGKVAARADDLLNLLPARLTGVLLAGGGVSWNRLRAEAALTPSPNAGWPMAALALRLGVRLAKPGVYALGEPGRAVGAADTRAALRLARNRGWAVAAAAAVVAWIRRRR
ncbi:cobalamin biosynthesis protein CobD [Jiangella ureilytica]|uniref:Cobalamin biosynthesis protein CobD n=1 Tax=Jiangella ureilytica TaxID=2530374 RepID=A0A4R4RDI4_9ACTN|nr:adenosylcobinamide-phosphate synthase CbiB [Jiangella ureilytica]TDC47358.1 cobalamin biosynthesis protein CobD [Jiangella ureilytica]